MLLSSAPKTEAKGTSFSPSSPRQGGRVDRHHLQVRKRQSTLLPHAYIPSLNFLSLAFLVCKMGTSTNLWESWGQNSMIHGRSWCLDRVKVWEMSAPHAVYHRTLFSSHPTSPGGAGSTEIKVSSHHLQTLPGHLTSCQSLLLTDLFTGLPHTPLLFCNPLAISPLQSALIEYLAQSLACGCVTLLLLFLP